MGLREPTPYEVLGVGVSTVSLPFLFSYLVAVGLTVTVSPQQDHDDVWRVTGEEKGTRYYGWSYR